MEAALDLGNLLGEAFARHGAGDLDGAMALYRRVLSADPRDAQAHKGLGVALCQSGSVGRGARMLRRACELDPDDAESWANLANACLASRDLGGCRDAAARALLLNPDDPVAHNNMAVALRGLHDLDGSFRHARRAVELASEYAQAHVNLGAAHQSIGAAAEARACFAEAMRLDPAESQKSEAYLFSLHYDESVAPEMVLQAHRDWGAARPAPPRPPMRQEPATFGFVSGDFRQHPVGRFVLPFLEVFAREHRVVLYANNSKDDSVTEQFRALPVEWRPVTGLDAAEAADLVRRDGVDVLFDLSGHTAGNRLDVFAQQPAPMQVTWLGYSATTGLPAMDWFLGDRMVFSDSAEDYATERLARLATAFLVDAPREVPADHRVRDKVRIGVTNNPAKLSDSFLCAVAQVLRRAPGSEVVFKYGSADCEAVKSRIWSALQAHGVDPGRIEVVGALPHDAHVDFLSQLDFCLDSFPYNGATTTMDALQAGTPVLTRFGATYVSRMTGSLLHHLGMPDWAVESTEQFVDRAVSLCANAGELATARTQLREKLPHSSLLDAEKFSQAFHATVMDMWVATRT
ncbi:MAG: hypothetical protein JSS65_12900 [Armatimonadetes bacterium]|nr:hypothetical protein [Armatimonadota bacterium]